MALLLVFVLVYFWHVMGAFGLVAMLICSGSVYVSIAINGEVRKLDAKRRPLLDKKSKLISDSILSIKNIKFNAWEGLIRDRLDKVRREDNNLLLKNFTLQGVSTALVAMIPSFTALFCVAYAKMVLGRDMQVTSVYVILLYLSTLKKQLIMLNSACIEVNSALVSLERIRNFMRIEDYPQKDQSHTKESLVYQSRATEAVKVMECSVSWGNEHYKRRMASLLEKKEGDHGKVAFSFRRCVLRISILVLRRGSL